MSYWFNDVSNFVGLNGGFQPNQRIDLGNGSYTYANNNGWVPIATPTGDALMNYEQFMAANPNAAPINTMNAGITNTGLVGNTNPGWWGNTNQFVNDTFGGWRNLWGGAQALTNMYTGFKGIGLMEDQLDLARDSFNFNKALTSRNLANSVQSYNTALADRYRARAYTETGNAHAYDDQIKERSLSSNL